MVLTSHQFHTISPPHTQTNKNSSFFGIKNPNELIMQLRNMLSRSVKTFFCFFFFWLAGNQQQQQPTNPSPSPSPSHRHQGGHAIEKKSERETLIR